MLQKVNNFACILSVIPPKDKAPFDPMFFLDAYLDLNLEWKKEKNVLKYVFKSTIIRVFFNYFFLYATYLPKKIILLYLK